MVTKEQLEKDRAQAVTDFQRASAEAEKWMRVVEQMRGIIAYCDKKLAEQNADEAPVNRAERRRLTKVK